MSVLIMSETTTSPEQTLLIDLLKAISRNQDIYPQLNQNLDKLNNNFTLQLRKFAIEYFTRQPTQTVGTAKLIVKFSQLIQEFDQGDIVNNLEIAITGYDTSLQILTREAFPEDWGNIQQGLVSAYNKRQQILNNTIAEIKHNTVNTNTDVSTFVKELRQEVKQTQQQVLQLQKTQQESIQNTSAISLDIQPIVSAIREIKPYQQSFNTVILYDIENLKLGNRNPVFEFSLRNIIEQVQQIDAVEKIAIQSAYADWSNNKFGAIKRDIQELGIEPVQIFGFSYNKNAADIQLAIDAVELTYTKPSLQVFVIVSGDGAFASLAKKLHQQGKTVIGCAYENHTNRVFAAVCDYFIWLPEPEIRRENTANPIQTTAEIETKFDYNYQDVLNHLKITTPYSEQLRLDGVLLTNVKEIFTDLIPEFNQTNLGFNRFKDFLISICQGTEFEIVSRNNNTEWLLKVRQINPQPRRRNLVLT